jgi:hypothetical protein
MISLQTLPAEYRERIYPETNSGCWLWVGSNAPQGYGQSRQKAAHRLVYERLIEPIPEDLELDHLCRTPICVNPLHLEPVTHQENMRRMGRVRSAKITHCQRGHAFTPENTQTKVNGTRECRTCRRVNQERALVRTRVLIAVGLKEPPRLKTHCPQGHSYSGDNLYLDPRGAQKCRECRRQSMRRFRG